MELNNPFILVGYQGPAYFCDREKETQKLLSWIENGSNITLIAPRRYGKTGLIHNVFHCLSKDTTGIYLDIYATKDLTDFTRQFASAIANGISTPIEKAMTVVAQFFKSCRPTVTPQENGLPRFSFDIAPSQTEASLKDAFAYLKSHERPIVIAIDEFQQIQEYPEKGTEALLRSLIQEVPWVRFIFAGSRQHLMGEMFATAKHPFYNSTDILSLATIDRSKYADFARHFFEQSGKPFSTEAFDALYSRFDGVTWYVQRVLNLLWTLGNGLESVRQIDEVVSELVEDRSLVFRDLLDSQNDVARKLLPVIAANGPVAEPTSAAFLAKCALSASSVRSAIADLRNRDILYKSDSGCIVYERLFGEWLKRYTASDSAAV